MIEEIKKQLNSQNNRATADPIFIVYDWEKVPSSSDYTDNYEYIHSDGGDPLGTTKEELIAELKDWDWDLPAEDKLKDMSADELMEWENNDQGEEAIRKYYYLKRRVFINVFFTEKAADKFIAANHYNYTKEIHTYVHCLYRNYEMQFIRNGLKEGKFVEKSQIKAILTKYPLNNPEEGDVIKYLKNELGLEDD